MMKIAYLEDDPDQADVICTWLRDAGNQVEWHDTATAFREQVPTSSADLMLLDWELPDGDGLAVLRWLRQERVDRRPIIFLTARDAEADVVAALEAGADDYLVKPLSREVTLARLSAVSRRTVTAAAKDNLGNLAINREHEQILVDGEPVSLTRREYELAVYLIDRIGQILPRSQLLEELWGLNENVVTRTLDTHISRIKKKLGLKPELGWTLKSIYHHGYRLTRMDLGEGGANG